MSENVSEREPVYSLRGEAGKPESHGEIKYHLLPEAAVREPSEGPLSIEERHLRSQEVAAGKRVPQETAAEKDARLQAEAQQAAWKAEKARRAAEAEALDRAEMQKFLESQKQSQSQASEQ